MVIAGVTEIINESGELLLMTGVQKPRRDPPPRHDHSRQAPQSDPHNRWANGKGGAADAQQCPRRRGAGAIGNAGHPRAHFAAAQKKIATGVSAARRPEAHGQEQTLVTHDGTQYDGADVGGGIQDNAPPVRLAL